MIIVSRAAPPEDAIARGDKSRPFGIRMENSSADPSRRGAGQS
jgi:hypothetical protein